MEAYRFYGGIVVLIRFSGIEITCDSALRQMVCVKQYYNTIPNMVRVWFVGAHIFQFQKMYKSKHSSLYNLNLHLTIGD